MIFASRANKLAAVGSTAVAFVAFSSPACAEEATPTSEIVVTASKRAEPQSRVPMSITAIDREDLQEANVRSFADVARLVPGLSYIDSGPGNKRYALRGLQSAGEPQVALFYDEIPVSGIPGGSLDTGDSQPDLTLWDVDRVEVLRGPQGTLYGNGSMGGAIRIISRRPVMDRTEFSTEASVGVTDGGNPSVRLYGTANLPVVSDRLAVRIVGYHVREGGWIDDLPRSDIGLPQTVGRDLNWEHRYGGRGSIAFQATPNWLITGIAYYQDLRTGNSFETYPGFSTSTDRYVSKSYVRTPWHDRSRMANLISTTDFGWGELTATASYQKRNVQRTLDTTRFLLAQFHCNELTWQKTCFGPGIVPAGSYSDEGVSAWSGEVRLASSGSGPLQYTVGVFGQRARTYRHGLVATAAPGGLLVFDPQTGAAQGLLFARDNRDGFDQYAAFAEGSYEVLPRLTATGGLRWFNSRRTDRQTIIKQFFPGQPTGEQPFQTFSQDAVFKKAELSYRAGDDQLLFVQAAQGFRAGGPNYPGGFDLSAPPYHADFVWDYELGWKLNADQHRLFFSGSLFDIEWHNLQQLVPTALFSYIANAGRARSRGLEGQLTYRPWESIEFNGGFTWNRARLVGPQPIQPDPTLQLRRGDKLANVPEWSGTAGAAYHWKGSGSLAGLVRLDATYLSDRGNLVSSRAASYRKIGDSALVDAHLEISFAGHWTAGLDASNLLNSFAPISAKPLDANFAPSITAARPRTVSLRLGLSY